MSSNTEKMSHNLHRQHRLNIFCRNPLLLKILAWLGCLGFVGSQGIVWAELKPISVSQTEAKALVSATPTIGSKAVTPIAIESYGPTIPTAWRQSPAQIKVDKLPNREVPIPIAPATAKAPATGKTLRPEHADILASENYTIGVNGTAPTQTSSEAFIDIPVPAPRQGTIPRQAREVTTAASQMQPLGRRQQSVIANSTPKTSINQVSAYRAVPKVPSLIVNVPKSSSQTAIKVPTPIAVNASLPSGGQRSTSGIKPVIVKPMKPSAIAKVIAPSILPDRTLEIANNGQVDSSVSIPVPAPRTQIIKVPTVAQLPQVANTRIPTIPPIPAVRPQQANYQVNPVKPVAYVNNGQQAQNYDLIYPLSSPAPITSGFGWRTHPITGSRRFHSGVDIGAPMGAPVVAAASGTIVTAGRLGGYGNAIVIQHNGIQQTLYGHLSEVFVQPGQRIEQGTVIGRVGSTGNSTGPHLHFESRTATPDGWVAIDPGDDVKYALDNLRRAMPFAQRNLAPGIN